MKQAVCVVLALFFFFTNSVTCPFAMDEDEVDVFMSGGQDHQLTYAYDSVTDSTTVNIIQLVGTTVVNTWKNSLKGKVRILKCEEFFDGGEDAIISAIWDDNQVLSYEILQFSGGLLRLKGSRKNIPDGNLVPGRRVIGETKGLQGRGIYWSREEKRVKRGPYPTEPFHQSDKGAVIKFKINERGEVSFQDPRVKKGITLERSTQFLILVQDDESPVIGKVSFLGYIYSIAGKIPGYFRFPFPSQGEVCITPVGFENKAVTFPLTVE
jgi:hypothetical protein